MERALLVTIELDSKKDSWPIEDTALELEELADTAGVEVVDNILCHCDKPTANLYIGKGKAEEIALICQSEYIDTAIFSCDLSGTQQRNLEEAAGRKIIDRTQLILDIFARHAKTPEGKTQVELAQLQYLMPRLTGKGIMLSRLGGGIGTRGPGEQKLEIDRRRIRKRIEGLQIDLEHLMLHRLTLRKKRKENATPNIALVGYTNAGKSTLINSLTGSEQLVRDSLFTTLDPVSKNLRLANGENIVISDTVGFLHNLPHHLIEAFKATLEEAVESDLLIHVLDVSHHRVYERANSVLNVLNELGAQDKHIITALNKVDLLENKSFLNKLCRDFPNPVVISAKLNQNLGELISKIQEYFQPRMELWQGIIPYSQSELIDLFYRHGQVIEIKYLQKGIKIKVNQPKLILAKLLHNKRIE